MNYGFVHFPDDVGDPGGHFPLRSEFGDFLIGKVIEIVAGGEVAPTSPDHDVLYALKFVGLVDVLHEGEEHIK